MRVGDVLRGWRLHREIGLRELAKALGLSPSTLSRLETGEDVSAQNFAKVLRWLMEESVTERSE
jgi:transcriptional regulator with XRE-family HTH domain